MKRVLIIGGGIAGLTAGIELLEDGGRERTEVVLVCRDPHLGGKAASWRRPDGRLTETGFHAIFGYYTALRELLARAGRPTTDPRYFTSNGGEHLLYEPSAKAVNRIRVPRGLCDLSALLANLGYQGLSRRERVDAGIFAARMGAFLLRQPAEDLDPALDELSFTELCLAHGLTLALSQKAWFRYVLDLAFNYPHAGSAYVGAYGFRKLMGHDAAEVLYLNGGLSEVVVDPLARRFEALGGRVLCGVEARSFRFDAESRLLVAVDVDEDRSSRSLRRGDDFDVVISALPVDCLRAVLRGSPDFERTILVHRYFRDLWHLRTVASISLRLWSPEKLVPPDYTTVVMGLPQPAATLIDYANRVDELKRGPWASVLELEGQEGLHAGFTDDELKRLILDQLAELPFVRMRREWVDLALEGREGWVCELRRNDAPGLRYLLMEPGHWKYRPRATDCPYANLVLAGDWLQSTQPTASMEAAVRTGQQAALLVAR